MMWNRLHTSAPANISFSLYHSCDNLGQLCTNGRSAGLGSRPGVDLMCFIIFRRAALDYIIVIRGSWRRRKSRWSILLEIPAQKTGALSYLPTPHWSEHAKWSYPSSNRRKIYPSSLSLEMCQSQTLHICGILTQEGLRNCANGFILSRWGTDHTTCLSLYNFVDCTW